MAVHDDEVEMAKRALPEYLTMAKAGVEVGGLGFPTATLLFAIVDIIGSYHRGNAAFSGLYRRLDEKERAAFARLWQRGEDLLRRASFDAPQWDVLLSRQPGFSSAGSTPRPTRAQ